MALPAMPDWLEEWERETGSGLKKGQTHPEARPDVSHLTCPQCEHSVHSLGQYTRLAPEFANSRKCKCPGCFATLPEKSMDEQSE